MRHSIYILIIFSILSCNSEVPKTDRSTLTTNKSNEIEANREITYISDSSYLNYDYRTDLKNGYRIEYRVFVEANYPDTLQSIFLMKDSKEIRELNGGSYGMPHKNIGYIGADFDSTFIFVQSFGSGNPHEIQLIDKNTGKELREGTWVDANEKEQVMLYIEDEHQLNVRLLIYDVKNDKEHISSGFENSKCVQPGIAGLRSCVAIDNVTTDEIILKIDTDDEVIIKKYIR